MKKDLFIDNNIAKNFASPLDEEYKKLIQWIEKEGYLVVSNGLLVEYIRSAKNANSATAIPNMIVRLTRDERLIKISNQEIKDFKAKFFTKKAEKSLTCNHQDRDLIPIVFLSDRKFALSLDIKFTADLVKFPKFGKQTRVEKRPQDLPYEG